MNTAEPSFPDLSPTQRRLIAWRFGRGMPLTQAAAVEGIGANEAETLLQDQAFLELVVRVRQMAEGSGQDRRRLLVEMARLMVERAAADGDPEAAQVLLDFDRSRQAGVAHRTPEGPTSYDSVGAGTPTKSATTEGGPAVPPCGRLNARTVSMASPAAGTARASTPSLSSATRPMADARSRFPLIGHGNRAPSSFSLPAGAAPQPHSFQPHGPPAMSIL